MTLILVISAFISSLSLYAEDDPLQAQKVACAKNTAMEWNNELNRCIGKAQARQARHDAQDCNALTDLAARKSCHINLATTKTGVTADPDEAASKITSGQTQSAVINTASTIVSLINMFASKKAGSACMSKSIMGITSMAGLATDIWMKIQTKKKLKSLQDKYQIDNKTTPYDAQSRALYYLKEEQEVVKKIAGQEKKRQMLLMLGYGAAAVTAGYESFSNADCWKKEPEQPVKSEPEPNKGDSVTQSAPAEPAKPVADGPVDAPQSAPPAPAPAAAPASGIDDRNGMDVASDNYKKYDTLESRQTGNTFHNVVKDTNGSVTGVVHNGKLYEGSSIRQTTNGNWVAVGPPSGSFNYQTGGLPNGSTINTVAVTQNYVNSSGRISTGSGTTQLQNTSFGTGKSSVTSGRKGK